MTECELMNKLKSMSDRDLRIWYNKQKRGTLPHDVYSYVIWRLANMKK